MGQKKRARQSETLEAGQSAWAASITLRAVADKISGMPFDISTTRRFCAAHALRLYDGSWEPVHGHNWQVRVTVSSEDLDSIGVVMDFHELERLVDGIIAPWHNRHLNETEAFASLNPTAEHVAKEIAGRLNLPSHVRISCVEVWETDDNRAVFRPT